MQLPMENRRGLRSPGWVGDKDAGKWTKGQSEE